MICVVKLRHSRWWRLWRSEFPDLDGWNYPNIGRAIRSVNPNGIAPEEWT